MVWSLSTLCDVNPDIVHDRLLEKVMFNFQGLYICTDPYEPGSSSTGIHHIRIQESGILSNAI